MKEVLALMIPILGILAGVAMMGLFVLPIWQWVKTKGEVNKMKAQATLQPDETKQKRLEERLANLEDLMCRLDREINSQLEKSFSSGRLITSSDAAGVSQMPTTFMNVATALGGRFQILKELGRGGMGIVFQAHDKKLNEAVAIKILSPLLSNDPEAVERLKREVSAARRVSHANVIRIYDIAEAQGLQYVSMEYFQGTNLRDHLRANGVPSILQAYQLASQICDGLEEAHRQGVIHRDLKSQNIIINAVNQLKIIDFGLAQTAHLQGMTATGLIMGTPEYMAPEQVAGKRVDERADIYSLGIILYEIFSGRVPFSGDSAIAVGFRQMKEEPQRPRELNPQIPQAVEGVILKALEKEPSRRYASVTELKSDLEQALHQPLPAASQRVPPPLPSAEQGARDK
jgi:serine/threonine protein kinase